LPFFGQSRGRALSNRRPRVLKTGGKMGLPWDAYYVLSKAQANLPNSKVHPNSGAPDYDIKHDVSDISDIDTTYLKLDASNSPLTGNLNMGENDITNVDKLIFAEVTTIPFITSLDTLGLVIRTNALSISKADESWGVYFGTTGFNPDLGVGDDSYDLGAEIFRWKDFYLAGNLSDGTNALTVANAKTAFDHVTADGTSHSGVNGAVTIHSDVTNAGSGLIITDAERTNLGTALAHVTANGSSHTFINQNVTTTSTPTFGGMSFDISAYQDYKFTNRGTSSLALVNDTSGYNTLVEFFTKDGDGTDYVGFNLWGKGTLADITNREIFQIVYLAGEAVIKTSSGGTGTAGAIKLSTGANTDQLTLLTDGGISMLFLKSGATQGGAGAAADELWVTSGHATLPDNVVMIGV